MMVHGDTARKTLPVPLLAILLTMAAAPGAAQQEEAERWRLQGSAGASYFSTDDTPITIAPATAQSSSYSTVAGDLRLGLDGFLLDPKLLLFNTAFEGLRGSNSVNRQGFKNSLLGFSGNATFLGRSPYPLRLFYSDSRYDTAGGIFTSNSDNSLRGAEWSIRLPRLPRIDLSFVQASNKVRLATSLSDTSYQQGKWHLGVEDQWKNWHWTAGFDLTDNSSSSAGLFALPSPFKTKAKSFNLGLTRLLWQQKAQLSLQSTGDFEDIRLGERRLGNSRLVYNLAQLRLAHTPRLTSQYSYTYTQVQLTSSLNGGGLLGAENVSLIQQPRLDAHLLGGRVDYNVTKPLRIFQEVEYLHNTPFVSRMENRTSLVSSRSGAAYYETWRGIEVSGSYAAHVQMMLSNLGNQAQTFSNDVQGRVGWGEVRRVRLVGTFRNSKQNLVEQVGAFTETRAGGIQAESRRLRVVRIYLSAERGHIDLLNLAGDTKQNYTNAQVELSNSRMSLGLVRSLSDGAGAIFPSGITLRTLITVPLPIDQLIATPLLNRTGRTTAANFTWRTRHNFQLGANWRQETNIFATSDQSYRILEIRGLYHIGKISIEGAVGNFRTEVQAATHTGGIKVNRLYFRISRDFRVF